MNQANDNDYTATKGCTDENYLQTETLDSIKKPYNLPQGPYSKKADELEALLENLQGKLSDVIAHIDYVKRKRAELRATLLTLKKKSPEGCDDNPKIDEEREKQLKDVLFEIKTRGEVLKMLEKKELLLSHAVLSVVSNWADEVEKNLENKKSTKSIHEDHIQSQAEPSNLTTNVESFCTS